MGHLFWQPTPVLLNSPVPSQTLGQVWADPYYNNEVFSSSIMPTPFLLRLNIGKLGLFPPDSHLATPLHLTVMSHPRMLLFLLYWDEKSFLPDHLHLCQTLWQWQILGGRWKRLNWWKIQIPGRDFFFTWFGGDMGRNCLGAWASGEVASLQPVAKKRVFWFIYIAIYVSYISNIKYLSVSTSRWTSPWAVERAEKAARASPKLGGVAGVFEGVPQGGPAPPGLWFVSYPEYTICRTIVVNLAEQTCKEWLSRQSSGWGQPGKERR